MSKEPSVVYRATGPENVEAALGDWNAQRDKWLQATKEYEAELGGELVWYESSWSLRHVELRGVDDVPEGWWRYKSEDNAIKPHRGGRTKAAKEVRQRIADIKALLPKTLRGFLAERFDIPVEVWRGAFGFRPLDGDFWVISRVPLWRDGDGNLSEDGNEHFERADLADYYRALANDMENEGAESAS